jgi:hypothetical protein
VIADPCHLIIHCNLLVLCDRDESVVNAKHHNGDSSGGNGSLKAEVDVNGSSGGSRVPVVAVTFVRRQVECEKCAPVRVQRGSNLA